MEPNWRLSSRAVNTVEVTEHTRYTLVSITIPREYAIKICHQQGWIGGEADVWYDPLTAKVMADVYRNQTTFYSR